MSDHTFDESTGDSISAMVRRHDRDLYRGNGKPGITTRLTQSEDAMDAAMDRIERSEKRQEQIAKMFWAIILMFFTILGGIVTEMVTHKQ